MTGSPTTPECPIGNLNVEWMIVDGQAILRLFGELDVSTAESFADAARLAHAHGTPTIVLDLSGLEFIDSSGLRQFVVALKRQREVGGDVVLRAPTDRTRRVLEIVGLANIFTIHAGDEVVGTGGSGQHSTLEGELGKNVDVMPRPTGGSAEALAEANRP